MKLLKVFEPIFGFAAMIQHDCQRDANALSAITNQKSQEMKYD